MWNQKIKQLAPENLAVLGVVQEQHAERTKLYKQWKQYDFPIAQDSVTKLGAAVVPIFIGIDEYGIVQNTRMNPRGLEKFLATKFDPPKDSAPTADGKIDYAKLAVEDASVENLCMAGDDEVLFRKSGNRSYDNAIAAYEAALKQDPSNGLVLFRLGCAYRQKYDEQSHSDSDFDKASMHWTAAMEANPRQYIWRRRIEQYGPRLQKPYPFYDWVDTAIKEIRERGETPVELTVELTQSELAGRSKTNWSDENTKPQSTEGLERDKGRFISVESTMVPGYAKPGKPATVHLRLIPAAGKWNNESTPLTVWIESDTAKLSSQRMTYENPDSANSREDRAFEFDLLMEGTEECSIKGFALYNVCDEHGVCMSLRQDFEIEVPRAATAVVGE